jgi:peroxiredoxin
MRITLFLTLAAFVAMSFTTEGGYTVGDTAADFELKNVDGEMVSMADYPEAKGFIVIFTCNKCPYSVAYEDRIISINKKYAKQGYPVIAINSNDPERVPGDSYEAMIERANDKKFSFPYIYDSTQEIARTFGATKTPHVFLLEKQADNALKVAYIGAIDDSPMSSKNAGEKYLENAIGALKAGNQPDPSNVKAIGCTIKWAQN